MWFSGRRFISLPVPNFCSLTCASRASPIWLTIDINDFYACCLRIYLHGPQLCLPSSEKRCTLFLRSSGHLENLLLQKNGENMLLQGICVYNYNQICEVHVMQIKTMTEGYDRPLSQTIRLQTMYLIDVFLCFLLWIHRFSRCCYCVTPATPFIRRSKGCTEKQPVVRPEAKFYHRYTSVNVEKRNISTHVAGDEHFLAPCPKYLPSPDVLISRVDRGRWSEVKFPSPEGGSVNLTNV